MANKLRIRQVKSAIHRQEVQRRTLRALGIRRMHQSVVHDDNPCIRGMVNKIEHLLEVEEINE
jgi:large subunit ribosomal protein L30